MICELCGLVVYVIQRSWGVCVRVRVRNCAPAHRVLVSAGVCASGPSALCVCV